MTANNLKQLEQMMLKEMRKMAHVASTKMLTDMQEETADFYTGGEPISYQRTGALGDTPRVSPISADGNTISFDAYLDQEYTYTTGSKPTMTEVLNAANYGKGRLRSPVGKKGFWERAEKKMEQTFIETANDFFK